MREKKIPVYVGDFDNHDVRNIPLSFGMRFQLIRFLKELKKSSKIFESYYVVQVTEVNKRLIDTLLVPLTSFLQRMSCRDMTIKAITDFDAFVKTSAEESLEDTDCQAVNEKNLKLKEGTGFYFVPTFTEFVTGFSLVTLLYVIVFLSTIF